VFIEIPADLLASVATESIRMPKLYYHPNRLARKFFWRRLRVLHRYFEQYPIQRGTCLDFGCGSGVFLPTLSTVFSSVLAMDMETSEAEQVLRKYRLANVELRRGDFYAVDLEPESLDVIVAADVLEHLRELAPPVAKIHRWLKQDGYLFTSMPTESFLTRATRVVGKYEKPWDHYRSGFEGEDFLLDHGFRRLKRSRVTPLFPLYLASVWQKAS